MHGETLKHERLYSYYNNSRYNNINGILMLVQFNSFNFAYVLPEQPEGRLHIQHKLPTVCISNTLKVLRR